MPTSTVIIACQTGRYVHQLARRYNKVWAVTCRDLDDCYQREDVKHFKKIGSAQAYYEHQVAVFKASNNLETM